MDGLPRAAMLLSFDIAVEVQLEHDDWHSHEHLPERLAIPGFLRGSRWQALASGPIYFVRGANGVVSAAYEPVHCVTAADLSAAPDTLAPPSVSQTFGRMARWLQSAANSVTAA